MNEQISLGGAHVVGFGAIERRNPLPPGRYWIDLFAKDSDAWLAWRALNNAKIEVTQHFDSDPPRDFIIFRTAAPAPWNGPGFPTIAEDWVKSASDTADRPPPEKDPLDKLGDWMNESHPLAKTGLLLAVASVGGGIVYLVMRRRRPS